MEHNYVEFARSIKVLLQVHVWLCNFAKKQHVTIFYETPFCIAVILNGICLYMLTHIESGCCVLSVLWCFKLMQLCCVKLVRVCLECHSMRRIILVSAGEVCCPCVYMYHKLSKICPPPPFAHYFVAEVEKGVCIHLEHTPPLSLSLAIFNTHEVNNYNYLRRFLEEPKQLASSAVTGRYYGAPPITKLCFQGYFIKYNSTL